MTWIQTHKIMFKCNCYLSYLSHCGKKYWIFKVKERNFYCSSWFAEVSVTIGWLKDRAQQSRQNTAEDKQQVTRSDPLSGPSIQPIIPSLGPVTLTPRVYSLNPTITMSQSPHILDPSITCSRSNRLPKAPPMMTGGFGGTLYTNLNNLN